MGRSYTRELSDSQRRRKNKTNRFLELEAEVDDEDEEEDEADDYGDGQILSETCRGAPADR